MLPVVRLRAPLIQWRDVQAGDGVGYNHAWIADRATRVATVSVGYADGYMRSLSNRAHLRFRGQVVPLIGRVSMDTITVDVSRLPVDDLVSGAAFDLIDAAHDINAVAADAGTNAYEILTSLGTRYRREYLSS
jgi:alanine racemase